MHQAESHDGKTKFMQRLPGVWVEDDRPCYFMYMDTVQLSLLCLLRDCVENFPMTNLLIPKKNGTISKPAYLALKELLSNLTALFENPDITEKTDKVMFHYGRGDIFVKELYLRGFLVQDSNLAKSLTFPSQEAL